MAKSEYEIISHNNHNFHVFLVNLLYRTPHIHKDFEINLILDGAASIVTPDAVFEFKTGDIFVTNPFLSHEISAKQPALILSLQISPAFFSSYYPEIEQLEFDTFLIPCGDNSSDFVRNTLLQIATNYFGNQEFAPIRCVIGINRLFLALLGTLPYHIVPEKEHKASLAKGNRIRKIMNYIDEHYTEKLLLSDIAEKEELDLFYLSHFFKESFGVSFQTYMNKIRSERARQLLLLSDYSLLDVSLACGFSDPKYFNKGFLAQYGCTPKEYRKNFQTAHMEQQQKSILTVQEFLSAKSSLVTLDKYLKESCFYFPAFSIKT